MYMCRHRQSVKEFELEKSRLLGIIESTKISIDSRDKDIERLKNEVMICACVHLSVYCKGLKRTLYQLFINSGSLNIKHLTYSFF